MFFKVKKIITETNKKNFLLNFELNLLHFMGLICSHLACFSPRGRNKICLIKKMNLRYLFLYVIYAYRFLFMDFFIRPPPAPIVDAPPAPLPPPPPVEAHGVAHCWTTWTTTTKANTVIANHRRGTTTAGLHHT